MIARFSTLFLMLSIGSSAFGQTILARAKDKATGAPLRQIEVDLVPDTGSTSKVLAHTTTDSAGVFLIDAPSRGTYRLVFNAPTGVMLSGAIAVDADVVQHEFRLEAAADRQYWEFEVEKPVRQVPGGPAPHYPESLRNAGVEGEVLAQFVVDTTGEADIATFKALRSTDMQFTIAVRAVVPRLEFYPALLRGRRVRQVVQMPFVFCLNAAAPPPPASDPTKPFPIAQPRPSRCLTGR